ncbi:MAG: glycosyltransferase [Candidatus Dojkabacteria bacterium]|jgi:glycosyltransferase involved in cell wall biosynthesis
MTMKKNNLRVAIVTDSLFRMEGGSRVLECFAQMFPDADIYTLFSTPERHRKKYLSEDILSHKIYTSKLGKWLFVNKYYQWILPLWPFYIERFDFSEYDLVISSSWSVAHGVITPLGCKHIAYINTPVRYAWDLFHTYFSKKKFNWIYNFFIHYLRIWDSASSSRADLMIANSNFVSKRMKKYWNRAADIVIRPPVKRYTGKIFSKRKNYFVAGAPFEENKGGEFLLECAKWIGFKLKIIGSGSKKKELERKYRDCKNIEFLGWVDEEEKYKILSKTSGFIMPGIEDFGIFPVEALSCGTPVLGYGLGGILDTVQDGINGILFYEENIDSFKEALLKFENSDWDYVKVSRSIESMNSGEDFKKKVGEFLIDKGILSK